MPHQYGLPGFAQSPPSPLSQHGALLPRIGGGAVVPGSTGSGSMTNTSSTSMYRLEDTRLTREAMERYMRDRNDKVIVILHTKVNKYVCHVQWLGCKKPICQMQFEDVRWKYWWQNVCFFSKIIDSFVFLYHRWPKNHMEMRSVSSVRRHAFTCSATAGVGASVRWSKVVKPNRDLSCVRSLESATRIRICNSSIWIMANSIVRQKRYSFRIRTSESILCCRWKCFMATDTTSACFIRSESKWYRNHRKRSNHSKMPTSV